MQKWLVNISQVVNPPPPGDGGTRRHTDGLQPGAQLGAVPRRRLPREKGQRGKHRQGAAWPRPQLRHTPRSNWNSCRRSRAPLRLMAAGLGLIFLWKDQRLGLE